MNYYYLPGKSVEPPKKPPSTSESCSEDSKRFDETKSEDVSTDGVGGIVPLGDSHTPAPASDKPSPAETESNTAENKISQDKPNARVEAAEPPGERSR